MNLRKTPRNHGNVSVILGQFWLLSHVNGEKFTKAKEKLSKWSEVSYLLIVLNCCLHDTVKGLYTKIYSSSLR